MFKCSSEGNTFSKCHPSGRDGRRSCLCVHSAVVWPTVWLVTFAVGTANALEVDVTQNTQRLMPYQVFELTFQHDGEYRDPTWDVSIDVTFHSPSGREVYRRRVLLRIQQAANADRDPDRRAAVRRRRTWPCEPADLWKARYAPSENGTMEVRIRLHQPGRPNSWRQRYI